MRILSVGIVRASDDSCNNATVYRLIERCLISAYMAGDRGQLRIKEDVQYIESQGIQVENQSQPSPIAMESYE